MNDRVFFSEMQVKFHYAILQKIRDDEIEDFILAKQEYKKNRQHKKFIEPDKQ